MPGFYSIFWVREGYHELLLGGSIILQPSLYYPYLDYLDFLIILTFSLGPILSWIFISRD